MIITQKYKNPYSEVLDVHFDFPLSPQIVFTNLEAIFNDKIVQSKVSRKSEVKSQFERLKHEGHTVLKAEVCQVSHDLIKLRLGNLKPNEEILIRFHYVQYLQAIDGFRYLFSIPTASLEKSPPTYSWTVTVDFQPSTQLKYLFSPSHGHCCQASKLEDDSVRLNLIENHSEKPTKDFEIVF